MILAPSSSAGIAELESAPATKAITNLNVIVEKSNYLLHYFPQMEQVGKGSYSTAESYKEIAHTKSYPIMYRLQKMLYDSRLSWKPLTSRQTFKQDHPVVV